MDWRGQGGSERQLRDPCKGHIDDFSLYERDLVAFAARRAAPHCPRPWIGLCHSMGGGDHAAHRPRRALPVRPAGADRADDRALRPAPSRDSRAGSPRRSTASGSAAPMRRAAAGGPTASTPFEGNVLTSDPVRYARIGAVLRAHPALGLGGPTVGWLHAAFRLMRRVRRARIIRARSRRRRWSIASGADRVVDTRAVERFADAAARRPPDRHRRRAPRDHDRARRLSGTVLQGVRRFRARRDAQEPPAFTSPLPALDVGFSRARDFENIHVRCGDAVPPDAFRHRADLSRSRQRAAAVRAAGRRRSTACHGK